MSDCEANIARLPLFAQQTGGFLAFWLFNFPLFARLMLNICPTFRLCNLLGGGGAAAPPPPPAPPSRTPMGIQVPREIVRLFLKELDPEGVSERRSKTLSRRVYHTPGPNHSWHVDGYDKLKPYGFPVHGCIDGYSRKVL